MMKRVVFHKFVLVKEKMQNNSYQQAQCSHYLNISLANSTHTIVECLRSHNIEKKR